MNLVSAKNFAERPWNLLGFCSCTKTRGFSLLEMVLVMGALAALGGVGYIAFSNTEKAASSSKIQSDVSSVNSAVTMYIASGGDLSDVKTPNQVLAKLKTEAKPGGSSVVLTGTLIDRRMVAEMQTVREAATTQLRALWSETNQAFEVKSSGVIGVKRFRLDPAISDEEIVTEARGDTFYTFDDKGGFAWDTSAQPEAESANGILLGPSPVERIAFPEAPEVTSPPEINSAIVAGEEAPATQAPAPVVAQPILQPAVDIELGTTDPANAAGTGGVAQPVTAVDPANPVDPVKPATSVDPITSVNPANPEPAPGEEPSIVDAALADLVAGLEGAAGLLPDDFLGGVDLSGALTDLSDMLSANEGESGTPNNAAGPTTDNSLSEQPTSEDGGPARLARPEIDKPGGGYLMKEFPLKVQVRNEGDYENIGQIAYRLGWGEWQRYQGGFKVQEDERLTVKVISADPEKYLDSYEVIESYYAAAHIFTGITEGEYIDVQGGPALVYNITEDGTFLSHGRPVVVVGEEVIDGGEANSLQFLQSKFREVTAGVPFKIGDLLYHNGTTYDATHATSTTLHIELVFIEPLAAKDLKVPLELVNTENSQDADASADYAILTAADYLYPLELDGRSYDIKLHFGETDSFGFSTPTQFHAYEGQTARVAMMATLTDKGPKPGGNEFGDWLQSVIEEWLRDRGYL